MPNLLVPRSWRCRCKRVIFFRNSICVACKTELGYEPLRARLIPVAAHHKRCANFHTAAGCNWLVKEKTQTLCMACRLNHTIPGLSVPGNDILWNRIETAKRRAISSLIAMGLSLDGLSFDLLAGAMTGHANGLITINIDEAKDSRREQTREEMNEPYRTLLGHFRHELGHFYWDKLIRPDPAAFRQVFGDEQLDYATTLAAYHENGPKTDWPLNYISAYASSHPWEDWAETWAHYMHMLDTLATARSYGLGRNLNLPFEPFTEPDDRAFLDLLNDWIRLSMVTNEMDRAMGQHDSYPFVLTRSVVNKLHFIHCRVGAGACSSGSSLPAPNANP